MICSLLWQLQVHSSVFAGLHVGFTCKYNNILSLSLHNLQPNYHAIAIGSDCLYNAWEVPPGSEYCVDICIHWSCTSGHVCCHWNTFIVCCEDWHRVSLLSCIIFTCLSLTVHGNNYKFFHIIFFCFVEEPPWPWSYRILSQH